MRQIVFFAVSLILAAGMLSCRNNENTNQVYVNDLKEYLALESAPILEKEPEFVQDSIDFSQYIRYAGTIGEEMVTLYYRAWIERSEEEQMNGYCGYLCPADANFRYRLREIGNEPDVSGFNHVVLEVYMGDEIYAIMEGDIQGRGDGFNGVVNFANSEEQQKFELMQQY